LPERLLYSDSENGASRVDSLETAGRRSSRHSGMAFMSLWVGTSGEQGLEGWIFYCIDGICWSC
jgi:hypothetical protein